MVGRVVPFQCIKQQGAGQSILYFTRDTYSLTRPVQGRRNYNCPPFAWQGIGRNNISERDKLSHQAFDLIQIYALKSHANCDGLDTLGYFDL